MTRQRNLRYDACPVVLGVLRHFRCNGWHHETHIVDFKPKKNSALLVLVMTGNKGQWSIRSEACASASDPKRIYCSYCSDHHRRLLALPPELAGADRPFVIAVGRHASTVSQIHAVATAGAADSRGTKGADHAVPADRPRALAPRAVVIKSVGAGEGRPALPAVAPWHVFDEPGQAVAAVAAPVLEQEAATVASGAVLTVLAGAVLADLTWRNGGVVLGGALAAVGDILPDYSAGPAGKRLGAPALELTDAGGCQVRTAGLVTVAVQEVPAITADLQ